MNEKTVERMAIIGCVKNPQAHTAEGCAKCGAKMDGGEEK